MLTCATAAWTCGRWKPSRRSTSTSTPAPPPSHRSACSRPGRTSSRPVCCASSSRASSSTSCARALGDEMLKEGAGWAAALGHLVRAAVFVWSGDDDATIAELVRAEEVELDARLLEAQHTG